MQNALRARWLRESELAAAEALTLADLAEGALPKLARALDAPIQLLVRALPNTPTASAMPDRFGMHPLAVAVSPPEMYDRFVDGGFYREFPHASPEFHSRYRGRLLVASEVISHLAFRRTRFYNEFFRSFDAEYQAALCIDGQWWQPGMLVLSLTRCAGQPDFSGADVRAIERIVPALQAAALRAARNAQLMGQKDLLFGIANNRPVVALDRRGAVLWMSSMAEEILGGSVPPVLSRIAGSQLPPSVRLELRDGPSAIAHLSVARRDSGEPFVVVELAGDAVQHVRLAALARRHGLTPAETRVLSVLAGGSTNLEIARRLGVSEGTVRLQLTAIFRKLGVTTRLQAAVLVSRSGAES